MSCQDLLCLSFSLLEPPTSPGADCLLGLPIHTPNRSDSSLARKRLLPQRTLPQPHHPRDENRALPAELWSYGTCQPATGCGATNTQTQGCEGQRPPFCTQAPPWGEKLLPGLRGAENLGHVKSLVLQLHHLEFLSPRSSNSQVSKRERRLARGQVGSWLARLGLRQELLHKAWGHLQLGKKWKQKRS